MKIKSNHLFVASWILSTFNFQLSTAHAQGTAFTYQGWLNDGANPASGSYDLTFSLYDTNVLGNLLAGPLTNSATAINNGLFTVTLDFGADVFTGSNDWLEISVRTNGAGAFSVLSPRQQTLPTPYAIFAANASVAGAALVAGSANSVSTTNISGTIADTQLSTNVALLNGSPVFAGTISATLFSGNGAGLTNVPGTILWQVISGTNQTAAPGSGYLVTNDAEVVITLPTLPKAGDVVAISGSGASGWKIAQLSGQSIKTAGGFSGYTAWTNHLSQSPVPYSIATSTDGTMLVFGGSGSIYTSADAGTTWMLRTNFSAGYYVASSADGTKLFAVGLSGPVFTSTNSGATWTPLNAPLSGGTGIVCSSDGTKTYVISGTTLYYSPDSGVDWVSRSLSWSAVATSADGTKLAAGAGSSLYTSTNSGASWTFRTNLLAGTIYTVASSADGTKLAAAPQNGPIYTSADSGASWTAQNSGNQYWSAIVLSSDGTKLIAGTARSGAPNVLYTSADSGVSWSAQNSGSNYWKSVAISADGTRLAAAAQGYNLNAAGVYTSQLISLTKTTSGASGYLLGGQNAAVELQCIGNGQFILINHEGTLFGF